MAGAVSRPARRAAGPIALAALAIVVLSFLWVARAVFITAFLGVIGGLAVARVADLLKERWRIPRGAGAPLVVLLFVLACAGVLAAVAPALREQTRELTRELPKAAQAAERWLGQSPAGAIGIPEQPPKGQQQPNAQPAKKQQPDQQPAQAEPIGSILRRELRDLTRLLFPLVSSTFAAAAGILVVLFIATYVGVAPDLYRDGILHLVPHARREQFAELLSALSVTLRSWLVARLIAMAVIGTVTGLALAALDVRAALALGVIAGLLEFVPFFGPILSAVPAVAIALVDSPQKGLFVVLLYVAMQQLEGSLLTPLLLKRRLEIPPVLTIVAVTAFGAAFGVLGMLIAEPLLACLLVTTKMLYVRDAVGDDVEIAPA